MSEHVLTAIEEQEILERRPVEEAETFRTLRNIRNTLRYQLRKEYGRTKEESEILAEKILKIHGLSKESLDIVNILHRFITAQHSQDVSVDANANKESNTITSLIGESVIPYQKLLGYDTLYRQMKEDWGKKDAKTLSALLYDYSLAIHDSGKLMIPYCWAFDASKIVFSGRPFGQVHSKPPKRISSYIAALDETIHQMASGHLAGAIAISTFFSDLAYILINREHIDLNTLKTEQGVRKYVENTIQTFIYSVNHLSRSSNESPFTNVSIFDRPKLRALFSEENMGWIFHTDEGEIDPEYFYDVMEEVQDIFCDLFDRGDPCAGGMPFRFPVVTLNFSKTESGELDPESESFLDWASKKEIYRYNIFTSLGTKVASCCRLVSDADLNELGASVNSFGGSALSMGSHRVVLLDTNRYALELQGKGDADDFLRMLDERIEQATKILISHRRMLAKLRDDGFLMFLSNGWMDLDRMFSTIGLIGLVETVETLNKGLDEKEGDRLLDMQELLVEVNRKVNELSAKYHIPMNIEQVPGESMAPRLAKVDKYLFGEEKVPYELYSNQFVPLWVDATIFERMEADGLYNSLFTGGGIVHFNLGEKTTPQQNKELIRFAIKSECEHFALNMCVSECVDGHVTLGKNDKCPICGKEITDYMTRVVGFLTRLSRWNSVRRDWEFSKRKFKGVPSVEEIKAEEQKIS